MISKFTLSPQTFTRPCLHLALAGCLAASLPVVAQTIISTGHVDIGLAYEDSAWDLHVHQEFPPPGAEYEPGDVVFQIGATALLAGGVPDSPAATDFFGPAGSPLWVLPPTETPDLPFLGIGAEEMDPADWSGNLTLTLREVSGPGDVFLWDVGPFGGLEPRVSSRDGISSADAVPVIPGSHGHHFWAFSAPGEYAIAWEASGIHLADGAVASGPVAYHFEIVPEPGIAGLVLAGAGVLAARRLRFRSGP